MRNNKVLHLARVPGTVQSCSLKLC